MLMTIDDSDDDYHEKTDLHEAIEVCVAVNVGDVVAVRLVVVRKE